MTVKSLSKITMKELKKLLANIQWLLANARDRVKSFFLKIIKAIESIFQILMQLIIESIKQAFSHIEDLLIFLLPFALSFLYIAELRNHILYFINAHPTLINNYNQIKLLILTLLISFLVLFLIHRKTIKSFRFSFAFSFIQLIIISLPLLALTFFILKPFNVKLAFIPYFFIPVFIVFFILFACRRKNYYSKENEFLDSKLENVLKKKIKEPRWFGLDPYWVDFEKGTIVERDELYGILKALKKHRFYYVHGAPASGKSVLLKNIGFKLSKKGHWVSYFDSREEIKEPKYFMKFIDLPNHIIILDNIHSKPTTCNKIYSIIKYKKFCKLILGSRPYYADAFELLKERREEENEITRDLESNIILQTEIKAQKIAEDLIKAYCKYENKEIGEEGIDKFSRYCGDDLVHLGYFLKNWEGGIVNINKLEKKVIDNIHKDLKRLNRKCNDAIDIMFTLAAFTYPFEFPISADFLTEKLGIKMTCIDHLKLEGEIREIEAKSDGKRVFRYSLWHSSVARLFLKTAHIYEDLIKGIIKKAAIKKFPEDLISIYIDSSSFACKDLIGKMIIIFKDFKEMQEFYKETFLNNIHHPLITVRVNIILGLGMHFNHFSQDDRSKILSLLLKHSEDSNTWVKASTFIGLGKAFGHFNPDERSKILGILLKHSKEENLLIRGQALFGLGEAFSYVSPNDKSKILSIFLRHLEHENHLIRLFAISGLANNFDYFSPDDRSKVLKIIMRHSQDKDPLARSASIWRLEKNYSDFSSDNKSKVLNIFFRHTEDENPKVREYAILGLGKNFGDLLPDDRKKTFKKFLRHEEDKIPQVRARAIFGLGENFEHFSQDDRKEALRILMKHSEDEFPIVRINVILGLKKNIGNLRPDDKSKTLSIIMEYSKDEDSEVRKGAISWLALNFNDLIQNDRSKALKIFISSSKDENPEVRFAAIGGIFMNFNELADDSMKKALIWIINEIREGSYVEWFKSEIFTPEKREKMIKIFKLMSIFIRINNRYI